MQVVVFILLSLSVGCSAVQQVTKGIGRIDARISYDSDAESFLGTDLLGKGSSEAKKEKLMMRRMIKPQHTDMRARAPAIDMMRRSKAHTHDLDRLDLWSPDESWKANFLQTIRLREGEKNRPPIAVNPMSIHKEGVGSMLQHYRQSLSYALALGLPWLGTLRNTHDGIDYTEYLGLCQPLCANRSDLSSFANVSVLSSAINLDSGMFKMVEGIEKPTVLLIDEFTHGRPGHKHDLDQGHTKYLALMRERFLKNSMPVDRCPEKPFLTFHFRWGDVKTTDYDNPNGRAIGISKAVAIIKEVQKACAFDVKLMSEGSDVKDAFAARFHGAFEYIDGFQSKNLSKALDTFACSTVLIGGVSSFTVLGALLSHATVITPKDSVKYKSLDFVVNSAGVLASTRKLSPNLKSSLCAGPGRQFCSQCQSAFTRYESGKRRSAAGIKTRHRRMERSINSNSTVQRDSAGTYTSAMRYLQCTQQDSAAPKKSVQHYGGGFGSMFQVAAKNFLGAKIDNKDAAVSITGEFKWYTQNTGCNHTQFECFFLDPVKERHIDTGTNEGNTAQGASHADFCKEEFGGDFLPIQWNAFWWGIVQSYMFSPNHYLLSAADALRRKVKFAGFPDVALHIRRGDKLHDMQSRQEGLGITVDLYLRVAEKAIEKVSETKGSRVLLYVATDDKLAAEKARAWEKSHGESLNFKLIMQNSALVEHSDGSAMARQGDALAADAKYRESLEFIVDLHFMMHAQYFAGLIMSQPARLVVAIGRAKGTMLQATCLDETNFDVVDSMKFRGGEEGWSKVSEFLGEPSRRRKKPLMSRDKTQKSYKLMRREKKEQTQQSHHDHPRAETQRVHVHQENAHICQELHFNNACRPYPGKLVLLVSVNHEMVDFFSQWHASASKFLNTSCMHLKVMAEDEAARKHLTQLVEQKGWDLDIHMDHIPSASTMQLPFGSAKYNALVDRRPLYIKDLLDQGCTSFYVDIDTIWKKNPFTEILAKGKGQNDFYGIKDTSRETDKPSYCTCFMYVNPTATSLSILRKWIEMLQEHPQVDQTAFNKVLHENGTRQTVVTQLPYSKFPPGCSYHMFKEDACIAHANFMVGHEAKAQFLRAVAEEIHLQVDP